jgi:hypothetical protein
VKRWQQNPEWDWIEYQRLAAAEGTSAGGAVWSEAITNPYFVRVFTGTAPGRQVPSGPGETAPPRSPKIVTEWMSEFELRA